MRAWVVMAVFVSSLVGGFAWAHGGHDHGSDQGAMSHLVFAKGTIHAHATWTQGPKTAAESSLRIEWKNGADHSALDLKNAFDVVLWMPSMGHGSSPTEIHPVLDASGKAIAGSYDVTNINFIMGGAWDVNVTLHFADGTAETQKIKVNLTHGGGHHHGH